jgi:hypothetical protein
VEAHIDSRRHFFDVVLVVPVLLVAGADRCIRDRHATAREREVCRGGSVRAPTDDAQPNRRAQDIPNPDRIIPM